MNPQRPLHQEARRDAIMSNVLTHTVIIRCMNWDDAHEVQRSQDWYHHADSFYIWFI